MKKRAGFIKAVNMPGPTSWTSQIALDGHLSPITAIASFADTVLTGGYDGHVIRWAEDLSGPVWSHRFADLVNSITLSPDGTRLGVAVADGYAYVIDTDRGLVIRRLGPHGDDVNDVAWSPDGAHLAVVCDAEDLEVHLWRVDLEQQESVKLPAHQHGVFAVDYAPNGSQLATASEDGTVRIWDLTGQPLVTHILEHPGDVETLRWSPDSRWLATGCDDGNLRLWSLGESQSVRVFPAASAAVRCVGFSPCGARVFAASYDGAVRVYDMIGAEEPVGVVEGALQWERACALTSRDVVVLGSFGGRPIRRQLADDASMVLDRLPTRGVNTLVLGGAGEIFVGTDCGFVVDVVNDHVVGEVGTLVCAVQVDPQTDRVVATDYLGRLFSGAADDQIRRLGKAPGGPLNALTVLPDGTYATGGYDGKIRRWNPDGVLLEQVCAHDGPIKSVVWSPGREVLVAGSSDNTLSAWAIYPGLRKEFHYSAPDLVLINAIAAPASAPWVTVASRDGAVRLLDPLTGDLRAVLPQVHSKSVKAIGVSPDGSLVVSGSYDSTLIFWHLDEQLTLVGWQQKQLHAKPGISGVAVDRERVASSGWDGTVAVWSHDGELLHHYATGGS